MNIIIKQVILMNENIFKYEDLKKISRWKDKKLNLVGTVLSILHI